MRQGRSSQTVDPNNVVNDVNSLDVLRRVWNVAITVISFLINGTCYDSAFYNNELVVPMYMTEVIGCSIIYEVI